MKTEIATLKVVSTVFSHNGHIPPEYTCDGKNTNPPLEVTDIPEGTKTLALIMEDPFAIPDVAAVSLFKGCIIVRLIIHAIKIPIMRRIIPAMIIHFKKRLADSKISCLENSTATSQGVPLIDFAAFINRLPFDFTYSTGLLS